MYRFFLKLIDIEGAKPHSPFKVYKKTYLNIDTIAMYWCIIFNAEIIAILGQDANHNHAVKANMYGHYTSKIKCKVN